MGIKIGWNWWHGIIMKEIDKLFSGDKVQTSSFRKTQLISAFLLPTTTCSAHLVGYVVLVSKCLVMVQKQQRKSSYLFYKALMIHMTETSCNQEHSILWHLKQITHSCISVLAAVLDIMMISMDDHSWDCALLWCSPKTTLIKNWTCSAQSQNQPQTNASLVSNCQHGIKKLIISWKMALTS